MRVISFGQAPFSKDVWLNETGTAVKVNAVSWNGGSGIMMATSQGLMSFNGRATLPLANAQQAVSTFTQQKDQLIYGCTDGSVYTVWGNKTQLLLKANAPVRAIYALGTGLLIGMEGDGLYWYGNGGIAGHFTTEQGLPDDYIYALVIKNNALMMGTDLGLYECRRVPRQGFECKAMFPFGDITRIITPAHRHTECHWVGFQEKGIAVIKFPSGAPAVLQSITNKTAWNWGQVNDILPTADSEAYIATEEGWLLKANTVHDSLVPRITELLNLGRRINGLTRDGTGSLWLATDLGLTQVTAGYLGAITLQDHFALQKLTAMEADGDTGLWYTQINELWHLDLNTSQQRLEYRSPVPLNCLQLDGNDNLWIGTSGNGMWRRDRQGRMIQYNQAPGLENGYLLDISATADRLWLSTLNGIEELLLQPDGNLKWLRHHGKKNGLGSDYVYHIFTDSRQRTWFATDGAGIAMYTGRQWHHWDKRYGFTTGVVYAVAEDSKGNIWTATLQDGLLRFDGKKWTKYTRKNGLADATITSLFTDYAGHVFAVSAKGIDEWYPEDETFRHVNRRSGYGIDSVATALNIAVRAPGGATYIPYESGLLQFSNGLSEATIRPGLKLNDVLVYFKKTDPLAGPFRYDQNHLTFNFTGSNFAHAEQLHYRYRLQGFNNDWINTTDESVTFPQLPPGHYTFHIQASLNELFNKPATAAYSFTITPPFWKTWWFRLLAAALMAGALYAIVRWRTRAAQRLARAEHERMMFEYEHLKSQVNPHFLFNSLNTLAALIEEDSRAAVTYTEQLSDLYRDALTNHRRDLVPLAEEWAVLERYYYIQQTRFGNALQIIVALPEAIKKEKKIVPLALQLLVENAVKHNVVSRTSPLIIFIEVQDEAWLIIRNAVLLKTTREKSTGIGLKNIRQRYALITERSIQIDRHGNEFIVKLPLL
jgi:ligand-binding sensor domain-containing protein